MKSPILLMFVFAITYCFNICDGNVNDAKGKITGVKTIVKSHPNDLERKSVNHNDAEYNGLMKTLQKISNFSISALRSYAIMEEVDGTSCIHSAKDRLKKLGSKLTKQLSNKQEPQRKKVLPVDKDKKSRKTINAGSRKFEKESDSKKNAPIRLEEFLKNPYESAQSIIDEGKNCIRLLKKRN